MEAKAHALEKPVAGERPVPRSVRRIFGVPTMRPSRPAAPSADPPAPRPPAITPPVAVIALNRLGFGQAPGDIAAFNALAATDAQRLQIWVDQQLQPGAIDDSVADARIAASGYTTLGKPLTQLWADHAAPSGLSYRERIRPADETTLATFVRAVYSKRQLLEVMADFWHNHFSVYAWERYEAATWVHYDRDVIRANALGNFRTMLGAVAKSTPMLFYLDNWLNSEDGPNENYPRELMELHTLGDENYFGAVPRNQVPTDALGIQSGFVDEDVFAVTRCLTGWSIDGDPWWRPRDGNGTYFYRADWHDASAKNVLGHQLPAGQPAEKDGEDVLDILASHPGTARFVCRKLCRRLVGDFPPESLVDAAAQVFRTQWQAPDQIAQVIRTIALSSEFSSTWGQKVKRPFDIAVSAMRAGGADFPFIDGDSDTNSFDWRFYNTGHYPFDWHPPNGYPDFREAWVSSSPRVLSWRLTNWLIDVEDPNDIYRLNAHAQTHVWIRSANDLADYWIDRILGRPMSAQDRQEIVDFMAQGVNPSFDLPLDSDSDLRDRLQTMVGLIFLSPDFLWR